MATLDQLQEHTQTLTRWLRDRTIGPELETALTAEFGPESSWFQTVEALSRQGMDSGEFGTRKAGSIRYGRLIKATDITDGFSLDMVLMDTVAGPHHRHPNGEIDMVIPLDPGARFDATPAGWKVYAPDSAHSPTVTGGKAIVLYFLPGGAIEFR